jgi:hypothetical protein
MKYAKCFLDPGDRANAFLLCREILHLYESRDYPGAEKFIKEARELRPASEQPTPPSRTR